MAKQRAKSVSKILTDAFKNQECFEAALRVDATRVLVQLVEQLVDGWMNDGIEEVQRVLVCWFTDGCDLGDTAWLCDLAAQFFEE